MAPADFLSAIQYKAPLFRESRLIIHPTNGKEYVTVPHTCDDPTLRPVAVSLPRFRQETSFLLAYLSRASSRVRKA